eukprot:2858955-Rhodomonas_salina.1
MPGFLRLHSRFFSKYKGRISLSICRAAQWLARHDVRSDLGLLSHVVKQSCGAQGSRLKHCSGQALVFEEA